MAASVKVLVEVLWSLLPGHAPLLPHLLPVWDLLQDTWLSQRPALSVPSSCSAGSADIECASQKADQKRLFSSHCPSTSLDCCSFPCSVPHFPFSGLHPEHKDFQRKDLGKNIWKVEPDAQADLTYQFAAGST